MPYTSDQIAREFPGLLTKTDRELVRQLADLVELVGAAPVAARLERAKLRGFTRHELHDLRWQIKGFLRRSTNTVNLNLTAELAQLTSGPKHLTAPQGAGLAPQHGLHSDPAGELNSTGSPAPLGTPSNRGGL